MSGLSIHCLSGKVIALLEKAVKVRVERFFRHRLYGKIIKVHKEYIVHSDSNDLKLGDTVDFKPCAPRSKRKKWIVQN